MGGIACVFGWLELPFNVARDLTVPLCGPEHWHRYTAVASPLFASMLFALTLFPPEYADPKGPFTLAGPMAIMSYAVLVGLATTGLFYWLSAKSPRDEEEGGDEDEGEPDPFDDDDGDDGGDPLWRNGVLAWGGEKTRQHRPTSAGKQLPFILLSFLMSVVWIMILARPPTHTLSNPR